MPHAPAGNPELHLVPPRPVQLPHTAQAAKPNAVTHCVCLAHGQCIQGSTGSYGQESDGAKPAKTELCSLCERYRKSWHHGALAHTIGQRAWQWSAIERCPKRWDTMIAEAVFSGQPAVSQRVVTTFFDGRVPHAAEDKAVWNLATLLMHWQLDLCTAGPWQR